MVSGVLPMPVAEAGTRTWSWSHGQDDARCGPDLMVVVEPSCRKDRAGGSSVKVGRARRWQQECEIREMAFHAGDAFAVCRVRRSRLRQVPFPFPLMPLAMNPVSGDPCRMGFFRHEWIGNAWNREFLFLNFFCL